MGIGLSLMVLKQITESMILSPQSYVIELLGVPVFILAMVFTATCIPTRRIISQEPYAGLRQS